MHVLQNNKKTSQNIIKLPTLFTVYIMPFRVLITKDYVILYLADDEPKAHFIRPESYQVTWWPGDHPEDDIQSDSTSGKPFCLLEFIYMLVRPFFSCLVIVLPRSLILPPVVKVRHRSCFKSVGVGMTSVKPF